MTEKSTNLGSEKNIFLGCCMVAADDLAYFVPRAHFVLIFPSLPRIVSTFNFAICKRKPEINLIIFLDSDFLNYSLLD